MKSLKLSIFCLFLCEGSHLWGFPSLFFSKEEIALMSSASSEKVLSFVQDDMVSLSSIAYIDESHWSLWVNNKIICSEAPPKREGLHIEAVTPESVIFSWTSAETPAPLVFTLHPDETFSLKARKSVDDRKN